jgi:hypothetical protein
MEEEKRLPCELHSALPEGLSSLNLAMLTKVGLLALSPAERTLRGCHCLESEQSQNVFLSNNLVHF